MSKKRYGNKLKDAVAILPRYDEAEGMQADLAEKDRQIADLTERLSQLEKAKFAIPLSKKAGAARGGWCRVIIPDTHGSQIDTGAAAAVIADIKALDPREVILLGDHINCGGFLAQHHTIGYVAETTYTYEQDIAAANEFLDQIQKAAPKADVHYLEGNHERRIERWCVTQALSNERDAKFLLSHFAAPSVLHAEQRGIKYYRQGQCYMGLKVPATIKLGHCYFTHGTRCGKHAAKATLEDFGGCVVYGHTHRRQMYVDSKVADEIAAWSPGCLCHRQPLWMHTQPTGWTHGYMVQLVRPSGEFLPLQVPVIDGRSYLFQLTKRIK